MHIALFRQIQSLCSLSTLLALATLCIPLTSCSAQPGAYQYQQQQQYANQQQQASVAQGQIMNAQMEVLRAQEQHWKKVEVTVIAPVAKLLRDDTEGIPHERFLIQLANGTTVLIAHDTNMAPYIPLHEGDLVSIHGEYIWTEKGGVIHWTHHTDTPRHEGGWIDFNGQRYQ